MSPPRAVFVAFFCSSLLAPRHAEASAGWRVDCRDAPFRRLRRSASDANEERLPGHKRDGVPTRLRGHVPLYGGRLVLSRGAGPFRFLDTVAVPGGGFDDLHGRAGSDSASAAWHAQSPWLVRLTGIHITGPGRK